MSKRAAASQRCFWSEVRQRSTLATRCATRLFRDSRQLVVFKLIPSCGKRPSRWSFSVSSSPSSRLRTADSFNRRGSARQRARGRPSLQHTWTARRPPGACVARDLAAPSTSRRRRSPACVPPTPLDGGLRAEDAGDRRPEALDAIEDDQEPELHAQAPAKEAKLCAMIGKNVEKVLGLFQ